MAKPLTSVLVTIQMDGGLTQRVVEENPFTIGRSLESALAFADNNVSRIHVLVKNKTGKIWIEDQGSANGTFVNGQKLEPKRLTAIEPTDQIRLGNTNIDLRMAAIEKAFGQNTLQSAAIPDEDRTQLMNLIHGAHAEAQRLVKLGKDVHDNIIKNAEERVKAVETHTLATREQILRQATDEATRLTQQAHAEVADIREQGLKRAESEVAAIHAEAQRVKAEAQGVRVEADRIRAEAEKYRQEQFEQAQAQAQGVRAEAERIRAEAEKYRQEQFEQAQAQAQATIEESENRARIVHEDSLREAEALKRHAEREAAEIVNEGKAEAARQGEELIRLAKEESEKLTVKILSDARESAKAETARILRQAEDEANVFRIERKRQESEFAIEIKRYEADISRLKTEVEDQKRVLEQRRRVSEEEIAYQRQLAEQETRVFYDEKRREIETMREQAIEEIDRRRKLREEEADLEIESKLLAFEKQRRKADDDLRVLQREFEQLEPVVQSRRDEAAQLNEAVLEARQNLRSLEETTELLRRDAEDSASRRDQAEAKLRDLDSRLGHTEFERQKVESQLADLQKLLESKRSQHMADLHAEMAKRREVMDHEMNQLRVKELERIRRERHRAVEEFVHERRQASSKILSALETELVKAVEPAIWRGVESALAPQVQAILDATALQLSEDKGEDQAKTLAKAERRRRLERTWWLGQGLAVGVALAVGGWQAYIAFDPSANPMKMAAEERARQAQADLEARKFAPPQDDEYRATYADSVIYTRGFVTNYLDKEFQRRWLKEASNYMLKQWRIQEETTVEALSMLNTLVSTLDERRQKIHPDFVSQGLQKMAEVETETLTKVSDLLGSEVRLEALRRVEKRTYLEFFAGERTPATGAVGGAKPIDSSSGP